MGVEESNDYSLRELNRQVLSMLEEHRKESNEFRERMSNSISQIEVHSRYTKEKVDSHAKDIDELKEQKNINKGFLIGLLILGGTYVLDLLKRIFT